MGLFLDLVGFDTYLQSLGYERNPYEKCAMVLPPSSDGTVRGKKQNYENEGLVLIEVDDILEGGNARHRKLMKEFYSVYNFGKC